MGWVMISTKDKSLRMWLYKLFFFSLLWPRSWQKQLKERRVLLGSEFEGRVQDRWEVKEAGHI